MRLDEILVRELREEHRDREWVDANGYRLAWCDNEWLVWRIPDDFMGWAAERDKRWLPIYRGPGTPDGPLGAHEGPFMEALYYRATRG